MNKKIILWIGSCFVGSITIVFFLFLLSGQLKDKRNSFLRLFPPHPIIEGDTINIKYDTYYFAGGTPHTLYLANHKAPLHLLCVNTVTLDTQHVRLLVNGIYEHNYRTIKVMVDSPYYYVADGTVPILFKGTVTTWESSRYLKEQNYFRDITPITQSAFAVKSLSGLTSENILGKLTTWQPYHYFRDDILKKQLDGVFCTDGMMHLNEDLNLLLFIYYYRNQFLVMDTTLNLLYQGSTIDTISHAKIKTASLEKENIRTLASPQYIVNKGSETAGNWLFVNSNLLAKNEHPKAFNKADVIDLYDLQGGDYQFSFYIHAYQGRKKMNEFIVLGDNLIVRYGSIIQLHRLRSKYFKGDD
jgi:hypothetical protein